MRILLVSQSNNLGGARERFGDVPEHCARLGKHKFIEAFPDVDLATS